MVTDRSHCLLEELGAFDLDKLLKMCLFKIYARKLSKSNDWLELVSYR